jgi:hypothetical protein
VPSSASSRTAIARHDSEWHAAQPYQNRIPVEAPQLPASESTCTSSHEALQSSNWVLHVVLHCSSLHFAVQSLLTSSHWTPQSSPLTLVDPHAPNIEAKTTKAAPA